MLKQNISHNETINVILESYIIKLFDNTNKVLTFDELFFEIQGEKWQTFFGTKIYLDQLVFFQNFNHIVRKAERN